MGSIRLKSRRRKDQGFKWARVAIAILATVGVIDTGSITLSRWGLLGPLSCPGSAEGCNKVLNSAWGTLFQGDNYSIPLSLMGFLAYLTILLLAIAPLIPALSENKLNLARRSWWGLFAVSCGMAAFSLVLLGIMALKIEAFCLFCFLSAFISIILLILSLIGGNWDDLGKLFFRGFVISIAVLLGGLAWSSAVDPNRSEALVVKGGVPPIVLTQSSTKTIALAKHLSSNGAVMYSAYWCPHCHEQKEMFGKVAAKELSIIECSEDGQNSQRSLCEEKGIEGFPTWEINGEFFAGVQSLKELSEISEYPGIKNF